MADKIPTPILLDTKILNRLIGDVLELAGVPASKKSACLNKAAARIAGPKQNWGFLTNQDTPVVAQGMTGYDVVNTSTPTQDTTSGEVESSPSALFQQTLHDALCSSINLTLLTGQLGIGLSTLTVDMAKTMGRATYIIRTSLLLEDEMVLKDDESRLQKDLRPRGDANEIIIFEDIDGLSDAGLKALENEITILSRTQPTAQIVLTSNFRHQLVARLRDVAPGLLNRAFSLHLDTPINPAIQEFIKNSAPVEEFDRSDLRLPSMASWDKAGEIMRSAQSGLEALREATHIVNEPGGLRDYAVAPPRIEAGGLSHLMSFMENLPKLSSRVIAFMRYHSDEVDYGMLRGGVMPKAWQDIARLVQIYDDACENGTKTRQEQHAGHVRDYARAHLRKNAENLLRHLDL